MTYLRSLSDNGADKLALLSANNVIDVRKNRSRPKPHPLGGIKNRRGNQLHLKYTTLVGVRQMIVEKVPLTA